MNRALAVRPSKIQLPKPRENRRLKRKVEGERAFGPRFRPPAWDVFALIKRAAVGTLFALLVVGLGAGLLTSYTWLTEHPFFALKTISVQGATRIPEEEILALAELSPGQNSLAVNIHDLEERLLQNPWIESLEITRDFPDSLTLVVKERQPSFWIQSGERLYYVDAQGRVIAPLEGPRFTSLPFLVVEQGAAEGLSHLPELLGLLEKRGIPFALGQMAWIRLSSVGLEIFLDGPGLLLRVGLNDLKNEMLRLGLVWKDLKDRNELTQISSITVMNGRAWVSRRASGERH